LLYSESSAIPINTLILSFYRKINTDDAGQDFMLNFLAIAGWGM
jgi:hypothetical protein